MTLDHTLPLKLSKISLNRMQLTFYELSNLLPTEAYHKRPFTNKAISLSQWASPQSSFITITMHASHSGPSLIPLPSHTAIDGYPKADHAAYNAHPEISLSERYPLVSQLIEGNKIPEFDNLYLDFNGIIHQCSHPIDDPKLRITEDQIFLSIFLYIDHLFNKIRPQKLFYIAVDGVAPRAKMNQQRSRRFRAAKEAADLRKKEEMSGQVLSDEKAFDSNCVTPGTPFMTRLSERLLYYINKKITDDINWRNIQVILSGSDVPGEGEHKIIEYIRFSRTQPGYDPNTRHCLYGLDADLIMLGLSTHEPHFCLLREEVKFGPDSHKKGRGSRSLEATNFYLLHLSLMREYLDIEFRELEQKLPFEYNLENVIDDFVLLAVFVGNDFLPDLPGFHISQNGLENLFDMYKKVLPTLDGYVNESGTISLKRLQVLLDEMAQVDQKAFEKEYAYLKGLNRKKENRMGEMERSELTALTHSERSILDQVKGYILTNQTGPLKPLSMSNVFSIRERAFITRLAQDLDLELRWDGFDEDGNNIVTWTLREIPDDDGIDPVRFDENSEESSDDVNTRLGVYDDVPTLDEEGRGGFEDGYEDSVKEKLDEWKKRYYGGKLRISYKKPEELKEVVGRYMEGIQWVIQYYYGSVPSWSWFYNHHYAPRVSDLRCVEDMKSNFNVGKPFLPFEQLMAVLPPASMEHVPLAYRDLMTGPNSPIQDFYPTSFELDLNGKKRDWEAVVKIPFVEEERLLHAMQTREHRLMPEEKRRNVASNPIKLSHTFFEVSVYQSPNPRFPNISRCHCKMEPLESTVSDGSQSLSGLCDNVLLGSQSPAGFPSLASRPHSATLDHHNVNVYGPESSVHKSRNKSVMVKIDNPFEGLTTEEIAECTIGERIFTGWPFVWEGVVTAISDSSSRYERAPSSWNSTSGVVSVRHNLRDVAAWRTKAERHEWIQFHRRGVSIGQVEVLLHVKPLIGITTLATGESVKQYGPDSDAVECPLQACLRSINREDPRFIEAGPSRLEDLFPKDTPAFFLGDSAYGALAHVTVIRDSSLSILVEYMPSAESENEQLKTFVKAQASSNYLPSYKVATLLRMSPLSLSKITSSLPVAIRPNEHKVNIGLDLKFDRRCVKVIGYTKKEGRHWEYSDKAVELLRVYKATFPEIFGSLEFIGDGIPLASDLFKNCDPEKRLGEVRAWLEARGVRELEQAPLSYEQLSKDAILGLEQRLDSIAATASESTQPAKEIVVENHKFSAILKPEHAASRLENQKFALGDRVRMVRNSGPVPLAAKGVVVGHDENSIDVLWDEPFMLGTMLDGRCSEYRGMTVDPKSCLNLTNPQFVVSMDALPSPVTPPRNFSTSSYHSPQGQLSFPPGLNHSARGRSAWDSSHTPSSRFVSTPAISPTHFPISLNDVTAWGATTQHTAPTRTSHPDRQQKSSPSLQEDSSTGWQTVTKRGRPSTNTASHMSSTSPRGRGIGAVGGPGFVLPTTGVHPRGGQRRGFRGRGRGRE
ncbi:hypothetical protein D9756_009692 [Leucocoprinus leucothites]|uniref:5'-3' exoribonuclease 1 n=1 Tax=Leucocoprinus leucothites TaxID=201217 RepID=A0A8H5CWE9_9AGAR|nr:hypothetical protein D9756_009692 [Leucoagaricus leucothites]